jgi:RNA polymerase sigma factor (sigma-70 family)
MAESLPPELARLLAAADDVSRERAWTEFVGTFSRLILHAARSATSTYDEGMEAYTAALEGLRADDLKKLRNYSVDPRSRFTTWLVVVVRRIAIDKQRERYGKISGVEKQSGVVPDERAARARLARLAASNIDLEALPDSMVPQPDATVQREELYASLEAAISNLDERDQLLLTLRFVDDLPARRIAELQGWDDQMSVYRRINHLTSELRKKLQARGVDSSIP